MHRPYHDEAVWRAVAEMEGEHYTREEIARTLRTVADMIDRDEDEWQHRIVIE